MWGKKKSEKYIDSIWGKEIDRFRNFDLISFYHNYKIKNSKSEFVDKSTWTDLNFNSIFTKLDRNISGIGQQFLFHVMHKYEEDESKLRRRIEIANIFRKNEKLRKEIQLRLLNLNDVGAYFISNIIYGDFPRLPKYPFFFYFMSNLAVVSFLLVFFNSTFLFLAIGCGISNFLINRIYTDKIYESFIGLSNLNKLVIAGYYISKKRDNSGIELMDRLSRKEKLLMKLNKKLGRFVKDKSRMTELEIIFFEYANLFFLFDLRAYLRSVTILEEHIHEIRDVFETVAELDTLLSLASYLDENKNITTPKFTTAKRLSFVNLYHPLVDNPVSNSIKELNKSLLITGSNMAGKTTFIKTVGINVVLARTLFISFATQMETYRFVVKSSIRREDNIENSKSYFFTEIEVIQKFLEDAKQNSNYLFLIDEIFRGTNTIERLATSTGVLDFLNFENRVLVTTHDIELQYLLKKSFDVSHFSEQVADGKFFFDYKIANGNYSKGNAIKLLEIMEYPNLVTDKAKEVARMLRESNPINEGLFRIQ